MNMKSGQSPEDSSRNVCPEEEPGVRCDCGRMVARLTPLGVEIKCKRCKRVTVIPLTQTS